MLAELSSKAGCMCQPAIDGDIGCPLMVRSTSEDVITSHLFGALKQIQPRWWLPHLLNTGLNLPSNTRVSFRSQVWRNLRVELWERQAKYPSHLIPWKEGITEVDAVIEWENPPTTIFIEMKYGSPLSKSTNQNDGEHGFPADQLIRNIRVGLRRTGWLIEPQLFQRRTRDVIVLVVSPKERDLELVNAYSCKDVVRQSVPKCSIRMPLPLHPFVGYSSYDAIANILQNHVRMMARSERLTSLQLIEYLRFKSHTLSRSRMQSTPSLPLMPNVGLGNEGNQLTRENLEQCNYEKKEQSTGT